MSSATVATASRSRARNLRASGARFVNNHRPSAAGGNCFHHGNAKTNIYILDVYIPAGRSPSVARSELVRPAIPIGARPRSCRLHPASAPELANSLAGPYRSRCSLGDANRGTVGDEQDGDGDDDGDDDGSIDCARAVCFGESCPSKQMATTSWVRADFQIHSPPGGRWIAGRQTDSDGRSFEQIERKWASEFSPSRRPPPSSPL